MKKILFALCLMLSISAFAEDKPIKDTTINSVKYTMYQGSKGGRYIIRTSKTTGKTYKQYFKHN